MTSMARGTALLVGALSLLGAAAPALAEDEESPTTLEVVLENQGRGSIFGARGTCSPVPDGTRLEVQLVAKGEGKDFVCALFRVRVEGNHFQGQKAWRRQKLAPMVYEAQVWLSVNKQQPKTQQWLMREYGFQANHKEKLDSREVVIGSPEERAAFAQENLRVLKGFAFRLEELRQAIEGGIGVPAAENEEWSGLCGELNGKIITFRRELDGYERGFVVLREKGFLAQLLGGLKVLGRAVRDHDQGENVSEPVAVLAERIAGLVRQITERQPLDEVGEQPLVHPDAPDEDTDPDSGEE